MKQFSKVYSNKLMSVYHIETCDLLLNYSSFCLTHFCHFLKAGLLKRV